MSLTLKGKVVLVTGAGSSVGSEIVRHFSKLGASVVMIDGDRDLQIKVSQESGSSCLAVAGSHTKAVDVINVISQTISKYRKLDSLINCVDFPECGSSEKETSLLQEYDRVMGYTGRAVYNIVLLAAPHLTKSKGSVVNVIDLSGTESLANSVALASLEQLTKSLAADLAPNSVRVNEITFDFSQVRDAGAESDEKSATDSAQDNIAEHEGVAESAAFLVSDAASYIIGASLPLSRSKHSATVVDGILKTSAMPNNEKPGHSKEGNSVHKASGNPNHKVDHASDQGGKDECSIHKSETANFKKDNKSESNSDHKVSDSKSEKAQKHESDKKTKDDKRTDSENNVKHSNGAVPGKHEEDNNAKHVKNGNQGGDHKAPQKNEQPKNDHGKFTK
ncbi:oxidoreductase activity [Nesidiocoris tenuis]|uniref:Oxidoreductase activity n=1 Tax=Nesidiocoris tenuis TaxID=355587 RepID=A0ABN7A962_9HEMI|nr:oxidoreductase activity [Nesidiocoris tenuis]